MKGLLLFIKNNRIIYKASIVSIIILMFISVMQINPNNEKKTISGTISNADYTICFDASTGKFSIDGKLESKVYDVDKIIKELEISAYPGGVMGEGVNPADYELIFSGVNFSTTAPIALEIKNGDVNIWLMGKNNKISSSYSAEGNGFYGITTTGKITFYSGTLEVNAYNSEETGNKDCAAIAAKNVNIQGATVVANGHGCNGKGIYAESSITIDSANVTASGGKSAIAVGSTGKCNVNGRVDASTTVDGELSYIKDSEFNTQCMEYKHVKIEPKVISVDITWGNMDFKYSESDWNADSHDYNTKTWSNNTTDGDKITVANAGNVPVTASIKYNQDSNYKGIKGTILQNKASATQYTNDITVTAKSSIDAYLSLNGSLSSSTTSKTTIGIVTVTISE